MYIMAGSRTERASASISQRHATSALASPRRARRTGATCVIALSCLLVTAVCAACGPGEPAATSTPATITASPAPARLVPARSAAPHCPRYSPATYGIDPNEVADTGGGQQLVTVVDLSKTSMTGNLTAWARKANGCWSPVHFAGQPAQPFRAQTGHGGLVPISQRVPGDWATPTGLYPFGTTVYGNSAVSPTTRYPYHHLVCGDWWDEKPGSPAYDRFRHVRCGSTPRYGEDSEALWTEVQPYQHFIDIKMPSPPDNGAGIFLHDDMPEGYTEGCVALPDAELDAVLGWLNPADSPHALIGVG
jgi:L,D-peptidoglycan transpeptidase YkuD (ErfK/YbiS/YcfS/YnhG family)